MASRELLVVANARAGSADEQRLEAGLAVLREAAAVEVARPDGPQELEQVLGDVLSGGRRIVVAGGDGSVHLAVRTLWRRDPERLAELELGLLPLGTGNDLATGLGLPNDPGAAAHVCLHGRPRRLDLFEAHFDGGDGEVVDEVVVNAAHAGLGASGAERAHDLKPKLGPAAYPIGALIAGVREAAWELQVTLDDEVVHDGGTLMVGVANGPSIGGGTRLVPPALPDDGLLDAIVVSAVGPAARLAFAAALRDEAHLDRADVAHRRGRQLRITGDPVRHDIDGELTGELASASYRVRPAAWTMLVPA